MQALLTSETAYSYLGSSLLCYTKDLASPRGRQQDMLLQGVADWELEIWMRYSLAWTCSMTQLPSIHPPFIDSFYPLTGLIHSNIHLSTCLTFTCTSIHLPTNQFIHSPMCPLTHSSLVPSIHRTTCLFIHQLIYS